MWSPYEIGLFEACVCCLGIDDLKRFIDLTSKNIKTKSRDEIEEFYEKCWKDSSHSEAWKKRPQAQLVVDRYERRQQEHNPLLN